MDDRLTLRLSLDDIQKLLTVLGDLPIKTGLTDITMSIKNQAENSLREQNNPKPV
jgi:hypothetical protein